MSENTANIVATQSKSEAVSVFIAAGTPRKQRKSKSQQMSDPDAAELMWRASAEARYVELQAEWAANGKQDTDPGAGTPWRAYQLQCFCDEDAAQIANDSRALRKAQQRNGWAFSQIAAHATRERNRLRRERKAARRVAEAENAPASPIATRDAEGIVQKQTSVATRKRGRPPKNGIAMSSAVRSREKRNKRRSEACMIAVLLSTVLDELREVSPERADKIIKLWESEIDNARKIFARRPSDVALYTFGAPRNGGGD